MTVGIACSAGGFKGAFVSGVLTALEAAGVRADAYAGASSSALPAAYSAIGEVAALDGADFWQRAWRNFERSGSMSTAYRQGIDELVPRLRQSLFDDDASRLLIPANEITNELAATRAQGDGYTRLGRELLLAIRDRDRSWADENLRLHVFDSQAEQEDALTTANLEDVLYSTSRYLHGAWDQPAWVGGLPFIDAVYTEACPAGPLVNCGAHRVLVIANDPGPVSSDFFRSDELTSPFRGAVLEWIQPARPLTSWGIDVMQANEAGLLAVYKHGRAQAQAYLARGGADSWA
ncbi:MAG: patatin-like phospholipase family protein [Anaerolineales bacterium]